MAISDEKQEIKKFYDKKFLTRKTGKKNKKFTKVKKALKENFWNFCFKSKISEENVA